MRVMNKDRLIRKLKTRLKIIELVDPMDEARMLELNWMLDVVEKQAELKVLPTVFLSAYVDDLVEQRNQLELHSGEYERMDDEIEACTRMIETVEKQWEGNS